MGRALKGGLATVVLVGVQIASSAQALADAVEDAARLMQAGKAKDAYGLLLKEEAQRAGEVDYDYLLGRAALDAGEPAKATLVFERVLAVNPNHAGARLDMGRAYFALGDLARARNEFEALRTLDPPPAARATIDRYMAAIDDRSAPRKTKANGYVEVGFGQDSNVTVGPRNSSVYLPVFGLSFNLSEGARAKSDNYHQINAGGEVAHPLDGETAIFGGADLKFRNYSKVDSYDQFSGDFRGGIQLNRGADAWRAFASFSDLRLGDERYREITTVGGDWRHSATPRDQLSAFGQYSTVRYIDRSLRGIDYDLAVLGASWTRLPAPGSGLTLVGAAFVGGEQEVHFRTDGNKLLVGLRGGLSYGLNSETDLFAGAGWQYGRYDRANVLYGEKRRDNQYDLTIGAQWRFASGWSLRPQVSWTRNDSNTTVNEYDRADANIFLRKDF